MLLLWLFKAPLVAVGATAAIGALLYVRRKERCTEPPTSGEHSQASPRREATIHGQLDGANVSLTDPYAGVIGSSLTSNPLYENIYIEVNESELIQ